MTDANRILLGVNIDHVATLRQARGTRYPDPVKAALDAEEAGADGITVHLREDRRHIQERDVRLLKEVAMVDAAHAPTLVRRDAAQQENKIRTLCICLPPARLRRKAVAMGVRPGTVDGRVPQQTPLRTPRTLSEYAARDSPAGTHAHEPSRPRHVTDAPHLSPACADPSRNEVGPGALRSRPRLATDRPLRGARIVARRRPRRADISPRRHATPAPR